MIALIQKVRFANIIENNQSVGKIGDGVLVYLGIENDDTPHDILEMVNKLINKEILPDENGKMVNSLRTKKLPVMLISQFTLCADLTGIKPTFIKAKQFSEAKSFYKQFIDALSKETSQLIFGNFGSYLQIESCNDGPVNFILTS